MPKERRYQKLAEDILNMAAARAALYSEEHPDRYPDEEPEEPEKPEKPEATLPSFNTPFEMARSLLLSTPMSVVASELTQHWRFYYIFNQKPTD